jgi:cobalt-zinc-cadmium efflux system outer membrane protein
MNRRWLFSSGLLLALKLGASGQTSAPSQFGVDREPAVKPALAEILPPTKLGAPEPKAEEAKPQSAYRIQDLIQFALEQNPKLAQAGFVIEAARGRALQAGLYPNPIISANFDELGDRTGPKGVNTLPLVSQEIVTGSKLRLSQAAAMKEVDQATFALATRRAELLAAIRSAVYEAILLERRIELLEELQSISQKSVDHTNELLKAKQAAQLDVIQLEVEAERFRAELEAAKAERAGVFRRVAAVVGIKDLEQIRQDKDKLPFGGSLDDKLPDYELDCLRQYVLAVHPDVNSAQAGLERAKIMLQRAHAEVIPNVTISGGYVRQNQNKSDDYTVGVSIPVPVWNRNQGNIAAAQAIIGEATREINRVENELTERVAVAYRDYAAARIRAERFAVVRKKAEDAYNLIVGEKNFTLTAIQRLVAQQAVAQARLEYVKSRGEAWKAASVISGLTLEEQWPTATLPEPKKPVESVIPK